MRLHDNPNENQRQSNKVSEFPHIEYCHEIYAKRKERINGEHWERAYVSH